MHDFLLAKQIMEELEKIIKENPPAGGKSIKSVSLEIGNISMAHDGHPEHTEEISLENLKFGLNNLSKQKGLGEIEFKISNIEGNNWKIVDIKVE